jgi:hypothetical protein
VARPCYRLLGGAGARVSIALNAKKKALLKKIGCQYQKIIERAKDHKIIERAKESFQTF